MPKITYPRSIYHYTGMLLTAPVLMNSAACLAAQIHKEKPLSVIALDLGIDEHRSISQYITVDVGLPDKYRATIGWGDSFASDARIETTTTRQHAGLSKSFDMLFDAGIEYEFWGKPDTLTTESWRFDFYKSNDNWMLRFSPEIITAHIFTTIPTNEKIKSKAFSTYLTYNSPSNWFTTAGYKNINYDNDFRRKAIKAYLLGELTRETLELLTVLDKNQATLAFGFDKAGHQYGITWQNNEAVFKSISYNTISLFYNNSVFNSWTAGLQAGQQKTESNNNKTLLYSFNLEYFW